MGAVAINLALIQEKVRKEREQYFKRKLFLDRAIIQRTGIVLVDDSIPFKDSETFFLQRELTAVEAQMIEHFPTDTSHRRLWTVVNMGPGLESINYMELARSGQSKYAAYGETEIPNAQATRNEVPFPVRKAKIKYSYEIEDVEKMKRSGQSLDAYQAIAAKEGNEYTFNQTAFFGNKPLGLKGYFTYAQEGFLSHIPSVSGEGSGANNKWSTKAADEIFKDCTKLKRAAREDTKKQVDNNVLAVGITRYGLLEDTYFTVNGVSTGESVMDRLIKKKVFERIEMCPELDEVYIPGFAENISIAMAYCDRTDVFKRHIPLELTPIPLQIAGFTHTVYLHADDAGLFCYRKYGGAYLLDV